MQRCADPDPQVCKFACFAVRYRSRARPVLRVPDAQGRWATPRSTVTACTRMCALPFPRLWLPCAPRTIARAPTRRGRWEIWRETLARSVWTWCAPARRRSWRRARWRGALAALAVVTAARLLRPRALRCSRWGRWLGMRRRGRRCVRSRCAVLVRPCGSALAQVQACGSAAAGGTAAAAGSQHTRRHRAQVCRARAAGAAPAAAHSRAGIVLLRTRLTAAAPRRTWLAARMLDKCARALPVCKYTMHR